MKTICTAAALVVCATAAQAADAWTCSYVYPIQPVISRFVVTPPTITETQSGDVYQILEDNERGLVAARGKAEVRKGDQAPTVSATTIVILKKQDNTGKQDKTGEFRYGTLTLGAGELGTTQTPTRGVCIKD